MNVTALGRRMVRRSWWELLAERASSRLSLLQNGHEEGEIRVVCGRGTVWVTCANDSNDYIVRAGETLNLRAADRVVAQGLGDADFRVERCASHGKEWR